MRAIGAMGDAAGFDDVAKQAEIGEIESHNDDLAFGFDEAWLCILPLYWHFSTLFFRIIRNGFCRPDHSAHTLHCGISTD
jgi:hypothetical protein